VETCFTTNMMSSWRLLRGFALIAGFCCLLSVRASAADRGLKVTLQEAVLKALSYNPSFAASFQSIRIARGRHHQTRSGLLPKLTGNVVKTRQTKPDVSLGNMGGFGSLMGGSLFATKVSDERLTLTQTILSLQEYFASRSAKRLVGAAVSDVLKAKVDLVANVKEAFFDVLFAGKMVEVMQATLEQAERQLNQAQQNYAAGVASKLELLRAEVHVANSRPQALDAARNREIAEQVLANVMGLEASTKVVPAGTFVAISDLPERAVLVDRALLSRPDVRAARTRLKAAQDGLRAAKSGRYPFVQANGMRDKSQGTRFPLTESIVIDSATVSVNVPIFDGELTRGRILEAQGQERKASYELAALDQTVELQVSRAYSVVANARSVLEATETAVRQATEALAISEEGYRLGIRTYIELMDAQLALTEARTNRVKAHRDYSVARSRLDQAQGLITGIEGVRADEIGSVSVGQPRPNLPRESVGPDGVSVRASSPTSATTVSATTVRSVESRSNPKERESSLPTGSSSPLPDDRGMWSEPRRTSR